LNSAGGRGGWLRKDGFQRENGLVDLKRLVQMEVNHFEMSLVHITHPLSHSILIVPSGVVPIRIVLGDELTILYQRLMVGMMLMDDGRNIESQFAVNVGEGSCHLTDVFKYNVVRCGHGDDRGQEKEKYSRLHLTCGV
jgi:hypothetical protein